MFSASQNYLWASAPPKSGNVSHQQAIAKAEKEFEIYRKREMDLLESDFDREIKKLKNQK